MREILFRGKRVDNGEWVCSGNLIHFNEYNECYIPKTDSECTCTHDENNNIIEWKKVMFCKVIPETVGQYTGLTDKNGNKIFEGDIVKTKFGRLCHVKWRSTGCFCGIDLIPIETKSKAPTEWDLYCSENLEVVGKIHDNLELVGGAE